MPVLPGPYSLTTWAASYTKHTDTDLGESHEAPFRNFSGEGIKMRSYLLSGACAATMLLALTPVAQAADIDVAPEPMGLGWYVSIFGGWSHAKDQSFELETEPLSGSPDVFDVDLELDDGFMVGAALGAHFNEWLRAEVEVSGHFHDVEGEGELTLGATEYDIQGEEDALFALANLWIDLPFGDVFRPYVGGGIGFGRLDLDLSISNTADTADYTFIDDDEWGFAYQIGAGVAFSFTENMAIDVGYRYKVINNAEFEIDDAVEDDLGLVLDDDGVEKDYKSHNFLVGVRFGF
jgi:opacity protein-like surface antigen